MPWRLAMSCMTIHARIDAIAIHGTQIERGVLRPDLLLAQLRRDDLRVAGERAEHADRDDQRRQELHDRDTEVAQPGVDAERRALAFLREEEADVGHARREIAAAESAQQREHETRRVARRVVLHRDADADRGDQQRRGRQRSEAPAADDRHHKRVEDAQGRAGKRGKRGQPEQLIRRELESQRGQIDRDDAPQLPDCECQKQRTAPKSTG